VFVGGECFFLVFFHVLVFCALCRGVWGELLLLWVYLGVLLGCERKNPTVGVAVSEVGGRS